jgi:hypothetical protein
MWPCEFSFLILSSPDPWAARRHSFQHVVVRSKLDGVPPGQCGGRLGLLLYGDECSYCFLPYFNGSSWRFGGIFHPSDAANSRLLARHSKVRPRSQPQRKFSKWKRFYSHSFIRLLDLCESLFDFLTNEFALLFRRAVRWLASGGVCFSQSGRSYSCSKFHPGSVALCASPGMLHLS